MKVKSRILSYLERKTKFVGESKARRLEQRQRRKSALIPAVTLSISLWAALGADTAHAGAVAPIVDAVETAADNQTFATTQPIATADVFDFDTALIPGVFLVDGHLDACLVDCLGAIGGFIEFSGGGAVEGTAIDFVFGGYSEFFSTDPATEQADMFGELFGSVDVNGDGTFDSFFDVFFDGSGGIDEGTLIVDEIGNGSGDFIFSLTDASAEPLAEGLTASGSGSFVFSQDGFFEGGFFEGGFFEGGFFEGGFFEGGFFEGGFFEGGFFEGGFAGEPLFGGAGPLIFGGNADIPLDTGIANASFNGEGFFNFGVLPANGDVDFYTFTNLTPGAVFSAETFDNTGAGPFSVDTILGVFDANGALISASDDTGEGLFSQVTGIVPSSGEVTVGVTGFADFGFDGTHAQVGSYGLEFALGLPDPGGNFFLPTIEEDGGFFFNDLFVEDGRVIILDPDYAVGYTYEILTTDVFFDRLTPPALGNGDTEYEVSLDGGVTWSPVFAGVEFLFGSNLQTFMIRGIDTSENLDPSDPDAFPLAVGIVNPNASTFTVVQTAQTQFVAGVPEPSTWALLTTGLVGMGILGRRRRRLAD